MLVCCKQLRKVKGFIYLLRVPNLWETTLVAVALNLKKRMAEAGRLADETRAKQWIQQALVVMAQSISRYTSSMGCGGRLRRIGLDYSRISWRKTDDFLARWKLPSRTKEFSFDLQPWSGAANLQQYTLQVEKTKTSLSRLLVNVL